MKRGIVRIIDWFYFPLLRRHIPQELFRYGFCGALNLLFDIVLYSLCFHFLFAKTDWHLGFVVISPHIAALFVSSPISTLTGFWLQRHITFQASAGRGGGQLFRYILVYVANLGINYAGLKLLVDVCALWATPSKVITTVFTVIFSFLMQKYFTFRRG